MKQSAHDDLANGNLLGDLLEILPKYNLCMRVNRI